MEVMIVCVSVLVSIFVREFAIFVATCLFIGAFYNAKKRWEKRQAEEKRQQMIAHQPATMFHDHWKEIDSVEEGHEKIATSPSTEYVKMDEAPDRFLRMLRLKR